MNTKVCLKIITCKGKVHINGQMGKIILYIHYNTCLYRDKYVGDWVNNQMDGEGIFYYSDGKKYVGGFKNDLK